MNIVLSEPDTGKAYSKKTEEASFLGKRIGDIFDLDDIGLKGFKGKIAGGSDKNGFPMRKNVEGTGRKKIFMSDGTGFNASRKGERKKKSVRGNTVSPDINQLNIVIVESGGKKLEEILKTESKEKEEEKKETAIDKKAEADKLRKEEAEATESKHDKKEKAKEIAKKEEAVKTAADLIAETKK